jgi:hypothetical protein
MDVGVWRDVGARHEIIGEIALLDPPLLRRDLAVERVADTHDHGPELGRAARIESVGLESGDPSRSSFLPSCGGWRVLAAESHGFRRAACVGGAGTARDPADGLNAIAPA